LVSTIKNIAHLRFLILTKSGISTTFWFVASFPETIIGIWCALWIQNVIVFSALGFIHLNVLDVFEILNIKLIDFELLFEIMKLIF